VDEAHRTCDIYGGLSNASKAAVGKMKERDRLVDVGMDDSVILKQI
jgi:hypothetical protein